MRAVIQRVRRADVSVNGETIGQIGAGFLVLLGISRRTQRENVIFCWKRRSACACLRMRPAR